jgi:hypothetical protein
MEGDNIYSREQKNNFGGLMWSIVSRVGHASPRFKKTGVEHYRISTVALYSDFS